MPIDFRASQIQTNKIIASGSTGTATGAQLVIYPHLADDGTSPNQGFIDQSVFVTSSIGTDVFLYVSGGIGERNVGGAQSISVFGGDLHVSGNLTVDGTYPSGGGGGNDYWVSVAPNDIRTTGSIYIDAGAYNGNVIEFDNSGSGATIRVADNTAASLSPGDLDIFIRAGTDFLNGGTTGGTTWIYAGDGAEKVPGGAASGGDVIVNAGNGGDGASAFPGPKDGGNGGIILIQGGSGGTGVNVGGDGGSVIIGAGSGNIDISGSGDGGGGGSVSLVAGDGASATNTAGTGGAFQIVAGDGGDGFDGASGGTVAIYAGPGGDGFGGSAAVGGSIQIVAGSPGFDNFNNAPTGSGPILIAGGLHSETFHYESGSNMSVGIPFGFGQTFNLTRIFFNRSADPDYAATNGLPLPTDNADVFFYVSGNIGGKDGSIPTIALFDGDVVISGVLYAEKGLSGSLTKLTDGTSYIIAGSGINVSSASNGAITISATGGSGLATGKQFLAAATITTTTTPLMIGQFSWVPADYTGLTSVTVRAIMSTDGTANHTGSLQIYNLTSGSYLDLVNTPSTGQHFTVTGSTPTLVTSSNLLTGITNFDNSSTSVYEVRVSGSTANNTIIGGVELIFS
jgi:hypothetical protein